MLLDARGKQVPFVHQTCYTAKGELATENIQVHRRYRSKHVAQAGGAGFDVHLLPTMWSHRAQGNNI